MNRTLKEATVERYHYQTHQQLEEHLHAFLAAFNFAKRLKTLRGLTPYEFVYASWQKEPHRFRLDRPSPPLLGTVHLGSHNI